jgi:hypothetical protein
VTRNTLPPSRSSRRRTLSISRARRRCRAGRVAADAHVRAEIIRLAEGAVGLHAETACFGEAVGFDDMWWAALAGFTCPGLAVLGADAVAEEPLPAGGDGRSAVGGAGAAAAFAEGATLWYMMLRCRAACPSEMQCGLGAASSITLPSDPMLTCSCSASAVTHRRAERG